MGGLLRRPQLRLLNASIAAVVAVALLTVLLAPTASSPAVHAQAAPDLSLTKQAAGVFFVGSVRAYYAFNVSNAASAGPTIGPITIVDTLPSGISFVSISAPVDPGWGCQAHGLGFTCTHPGPLLPGASSTVSVRVDLSANAVGERVNGATVSTPGESNTADNSATATAIITTGPVPNLYVNKFHSGGFVVGSADATYNFAVVNAAPYGGQTLGPVTLTDSLPTGMTFHSISSQTGGWGCSAAGQNVTCVYTGPALRNDFGRTDLSIRVAIGPAAVGTRTNVAQVSTPGEVHTYDNISQVDTVVVVPRTFTLTVQKPGNGSGTVASNLAGIACGADCSETYVEGTVVTLTAAPAQSVIFAGWGGACVGTGVCQVTMDAAKTVTATFHPNNVDVYVGHQTDPNTLIATLEARKGCGSVGKVQFGIDGRPFDNARVSIIGPVKGPLNQITGFAYTPSTVSTSVTLAIQRVIPSGGATVTPIRFWDGCGDWVTFVGGGPGAFR